MVVASSAMPAGPPWPVANGEAAPLTKRIVRIVFGYYLDDSEHLAIRELDVHEIASVVAASSENSEGVDFAWLRFTGKMRANQFPVPVLASLSSVAGAQPLIAVNAGGGIPLKVDDGATMSDAGDAARAHFIADIDAFRGASGSGVFNTEGALLGIVARGNADFVNDESGCRTTIRLPSAEAKEQVLFVQRAIDGLCAVEPDTSLCDLNCAQPCRPSRTPKSNDDASCSVSYRHPIKRAWGAIGTFLLLALASRQRNAGRQRGLKGLRRSIPSVTRKPRK